MPPTPIPIDHNSQIINENVASVQQPTGFPLSWRFEITSGKGMFGFLGRNCTFEVSSSTPCNLGIYGPNPGQVGPPWGRMRSPKINNPDAMHHRCQGNFKPGVYYLVVRQGDNGPPTSAVKLMITSNNWQVF